MIRGITPKDAAVSLWDAGYVCVSGKFFKLDKSTDRYCWVPYEEFERHIMSKSYTTTAKDTKDITDAFVRMYNIAAEWPAPQLWFDAQTFNRDVKLKFDFDDKIYKIINLLLTSNGYERFFILYGPAGTGKSTVLNLIKQIFDNDCGVFSLSQLCERFAPSEACQYRLITHSELDTNEINSNRIKSIISREDGTVERKGQQPFNIKWQSRLLYACNEMPWIDIGDTGLMRRIVVFKMDKPFKKFDKNVRDYVYSPEELKYIIHKALNMDMTDWFEDFRRDTFEAVTEHNPVYMFRREPAYEEYAMRCHQKGYKACNEYHWLRIKEYIKEQENLLK